MLCRFFFSIQRNCELMLRSGCSETDIEHLSQTCAGSGNKHKSSSRDETVEEEGDKAKLKKAWKTDWLLTNKWREHLHGADTKPNVSEGPLLTRIFYTSFRIDCFSFIALFFKAFRSSCGGVKMYEKRNFLSVELLKLKEKHFHTCQQTHLMVLTHVFLLAGAGIIPKQKQHKTIR